MTKSAILLSVVALLSLGACSGMRGNKSERQEDNMAKTRDIQKQEAETARDYDTESGYFEDDMEMQEEGLNSDSDYQEDGRDTGVEHPAQGDDYEQREEDNKARKAKHEQLDPDSLEEE